MLKEIIMHECIYNVKFLLKGLVELRLNNWVPQGPEKGPRNIRKIHHVQRRGEKDAHRAAYDANSRRNTPESSWRRSEYLHLVGSCITHNYN